MENQTPERRFALLIDADNVSAKYLKPILDELSKYGTVTYKRIYGDWTLNLHAKWKEALLKNSITPIQQFGYTQGKNATDSAMIIDAMDILYANSVEGFCIVSSDSDFTRLAVRLRESGRMVIGMGEKKTPTPFRTACDVFTTLELLAPERPSRSKRGRRNKTEELEVVQEATATREQIEQAVVDIITDNINNGKATGLGEVGSRLLKRYPDFDVRSYGTSQISKLLDSFASVVVHKDGYNVDVELAEGVEPGTVLEFDAAEPEATAEAIVEQAEPSAEAVAEEAPAVEAEAASDANTSGRRRRRRGGRSRKKSDAATVETEAVEQSAEEKAEEAVTEPVEEPQEQIQELEPPAAPEKPKRTRRTRKPKAEKPAPEPEAEAVEEKPAAAFDVSKVNAYLSSQVQNAGAEGISVGSLSKKVRGKFREFKLRDLGFQNLRAYLATIDGLSVEKQDGDYRVKLGD